MCYFPRWLLRRIEGGAFTHFFVNTSSYCRHFVSLMALRILDRWLSVELFQLVVKILVWVWWTTLCLLFACLVLVVPLDLNASSCNITATFLTNTFINCFALFPFCNLQFLFGDLFFSGWDLVFLFFALFSVPIHSNRSWQVVFKIWARLLFWRRHGLDSL